jgi:hypothetical protein
MSQLKMKSIDIKECYRVLIVYISDKSFERNTMTSNKLATLAWKRFSNLYSETSSGYRWSDGVQTMFPHFPIDQRTGRCFTCSMYHSTVWSVFMFPVMKHPWTCIMNLPVSNGCQSIWVEVDCFRNMSHFIPLNDREMMSPYLVPRFLR